jgi:uncharacterized protein (TIGR01777 family)
VLSLEGGALKQMIVPIKLGIGGRIGSGKQWFPWIHIDDIIGIFKYAIFSEALAGPVNGVAPDQVTNGEFTRELARALHRPAFLPVPETALRVLVGEMADVLIGSQKIVPKVALASGYKFRHPQLAPALLSLLHSRPGFNA